MFSALTFNMQNGQVWNEEDPDQAEVSLACSVAFLCEQDADIIFLQEVERGFDGGGQIEPPPHYERLKAALPGYDSCFAYPRPNRMEIPLAARPSFEDTAEKFRSKGSSACRDRV